MERSDKYKTAVCNVSGMISIYNPSKNLFISPMADGPIKYTGSLDGKSMNIENITKFGRDFSVVEVPYSLKLLIQELQTMNIQMRIITEDNIEQLENMTFSKNIDNLMYSSDVTPQTIIGQIRQTLNSNKVSSEPVPGSCEQTREPPLEFPSISPAYQPSSLPEFVPYSPLESPPTELSPLSESSSIDSLPPAGFFTSIYEPKSPTEPPPFDDSPGSLPPAGFFRRDNEDENEDSNKMFKGGEKVHYRGDKHPERVWSVEKIGPEFITIVTDDGHDIRAEDKIKVVEPFDIYRQGDYNYNTMIPTNKGPMFMPQEKTFSNQAPAGINFAPVIKINNGGTEYSSDGLSDSQPKISFDNSEVRIPAIEPSKNIVFKKELNEPTQMIMKEDNKKTEGGEGGGGGGILSGIKDFIIKKLG